MEQLNLKCTLNKDGSITSSWNAISNIIRYETYMFDINKTYTIYNEQNLLATSYTSPANLPANAQYKIVVTAYSQSEGIIGDSEKILIPSDFYDNTPLDIPKNVKATSDAISVTVSFDAVLRASTYDILFDGSVYNTTATSKKFTGFTPKTSHTYAVRAKNSGKTGEYSDTKSIMTLPLSPAIPMNLKKSVTENSATFSWGAVSTATSYDIVFNGTTYSVTETTKTFTGLNAGTSYTFKIRSKNADGASQYTNEITVMTAPNPPASVTATCTDKVVTVSWSTVSGAAGYIVQFNNEDTYMAASDTSCMFTDLKPNTTYTYRVCSRSVDGAGAYSTAKTIRTLQEAPKMPEIPSNVTKTSTENSVTVSWNAVSGATGYDVMFNESIYSVNGTSKTFTGLSANTSYTYKVRSKNADGVSEYGAVQTVRTTPIAPSSASAATNENSITISWNAVTGATSYDLMFNNKVYNVTGTSKTIAGLSANTSYSYQIRVNNQDGSSSYSASKTVKTSPVPPASPSASTTNDSVTVSWNAVTGATSYDVLFNGTAYRVTGTSKTITGLTPGTSYTYSVRSNNADGSSSYCAQKTVTTAVSAPGVPTNISATATSNSVTISWSAVTGATGYDVLFNGTTYSATGTFQIITGLISERTYSYQVRAKNSAGTSAYSASQTVKTLMNPPAEPGNVKAVASKNSVTVSWSAVSRAASYDVMFNNTVYNTTNTSKFITGLVPGSSYTYAVRAKNEGGVSAYSAVKTIKTFLDVPLGIQAVSTSDTVTVSWNPVNGATGYIIKFNGKAYNVTDTSKTFTGLTPETEYTYAVRSLSETDISEYSSEFVISTLRAELPAPDVWAEATLNSVVVKWNILQEAERYEVLFDGKSSSLPVSNARMRANALTSRNSDSIEITGTVASKRYSGLMPNTEHTYCVRAINNAGAGEYSPLGTIKTSISKIQSAISNGRQNKTYPDGRLPQMGMDPVNALTGAFLWSYTLLRDYGKDNLHFTVMYDSQRDEHIRLLGNGWTHSLNYVLYEDNEYMYFGTPYDEVIPFKREDGNDSFQPAEDMQSGYCMERMPDGSYSVKVIDGTEYIFDCNLSLKEIMEGGLIAYRFLTDENHRIISIRGRHGGSISFAYAGEHIASVTDDMENTVRLLYDGDSLASVENPAGGIMSFGYDNTGRLVNICDFSGEDYLTNWYDTYGKVVAQSIAGRGNSYASYDPIEKVTVFTDELGNKTRYFYDENGHITRVELGEKGIQNCYNKMGQVTEQTDALGNTTQMFYDDHGRMNRVIHPDGTEERTTYNDRNYPVGIVKRDGSESLFGYDDRNNLISARDERGNMCTYAYDDNDNLISYTDKEGNVWTYAYDENNYLMQAQDPDGNIYCYSHDAIGRMTSYTSPEGRTVVYQYSAAGDLLSITDADGSLLFEYDNNGSCTSITDRNGNSRRLEYNRMGQVSLTTDFMGKEYRFAYDEKGNLTEETDPLGYRVRYIYDDCGNIVSRTDQNGNTTGFVFDAANQMTEVKDAAGGTVKYTYDTIGQVKTVIDPLDHQTAYDYDSVGRITGVTDALEHTVSYTYDEAGNLLTRTDEDGAVTSYTYDRENRLLAISTDAGITSFSYDKLGRVISVQDTEGYREQAQYDGDGSLTAAIDKEGSTTTYVYDDSGRLSEKTTPGTGTTFYAYDKSGNCIKITNAEGGENNYEYDANNRLIKIIDPLKQETVYEYDDRGQLICITDARGGRTESAYDGNGNLIRQTNPLGGIRTYSYDSLNRLTESTDEEGNKCTYDYDAAGNMIFFVDANQNRWSYTYDEINRLVSVTDQNDDSLIYDYTNTGRVAKVTDKEGAVTNYCYDALGRLTVMSDALGNSLKFTYDTLGRMLSQTDANGNTTEYEYSPAGNLLSVKEPEGGTISYTYNKAGQVLTKTDALGNVVTFEYDTLGQVTSITDALGGRTFFTYTANGQIATVTDAAGGITWYTYDAVGNLVRTVNPLGTVAVYEYDAMNNQIKECLSSSGEQTCITLYQYDKKGRRIREIDPLLEEKAYTYDGNDNVTAILDEEQKETSVRYDLNNRPVYMGLSDGRKASFRYNKRGELVEIRDWNGTTSMERDRLGKLTKVTDPEGRSVGYGYDAVGNLTGITYPDESVVSYAYDGNRRLTKVTDAEGKLTQYAYDNAGRVAFLDQPCGTTAYAYNACGLPTQIRYQLSDGIVMEDSLAYDIMGRITDSKRSGVTPELTRNAAYTYDAIGQLLSLREGQTTESYAYDMQGNRIRKEVNGKERAVYQYNALNQLTAMTEDGIQYRFDYDKRGNLTEERRGERSIRQYIYDDANRMVLGRNLESGEKTEYAYNALNMRIQNVQTLADGESFRRREISYVPDYLSAACNELMAYEKGYGTIRTVFGRGGERLGQKMTAVPEASSVSSVIAAASIGKAYFQPDLYGSPLFASDEQGQVIRYAERGIWGDLKLPARGDLNLAGLEDSLRFTTYCHDPAIGRYFAHARFYDSAQGRMLSKDPVKRGFNSYHYCNNDPVNYTDPTGEVANILISAGLGALTGGASAFASSAVSQLISGEDFNLREALGAAANGAVTGGVRGALLGSGVGIPLALTANFTAGTAGSLLEQYICEGTIDVRKGITAGLHNAVDEAIYGNGEIKNLWDAVERGVKSGAARSGIDYLAEALGPQKRARRSPIIPNPAAIPSGGMRDPRSGCGVPSPFKNSMGYGSDYGYQYNVPMTGSGSSQEDRKGFSLGAFIAETVTGGITGGVSSAAFYGGGKALEALKRSVKGAFGNKSGIEYDLYRRTQNTSEFEQMEELMTLKNVKKVAKDAEINYDGIKISIDRNPELIGRGYYGYTWPNGKKVTLYPDAFKNKEMLIKTLGHERIHVYQVKTFGAPETDKIAKMFEDAAYASENDWWKYYLMNGGKG